MRLKYSSTGPCLKVQIFLFPPFLVDFHYSFTIVQGTLPIKLLHMILQLKLIWGCQVPKLSCMLNVILSNLDLLTVNQALPNKTYPVKASIFLLLHLCYLFSVLLTRSR